MTADACVETFSFLYSVEFQSTSFHILTFFELPLHTFAAYVILKKTPAKMKSVKWIMLNLHFWTALLDVSLSSLTTSYVLFPAAAGISMGLFDWFGLDRALMTVYIVVVIGMVVMSTLVLFENRFSIITMSDVYWIRVRRGFIAFGYLFAVVYFLPVVYLVPDQNEAVLIVRKRLPTLSCFYNGPIYVLTLDATIPAWVTAAKLAVELLSCLYFAVLTFWSLINQSKRARLSRATLNMQKKLFFAIISQIMIPVIVIIFPLAVCAHALAANYFNQAMNNISFLIISSHGLVSTIAMLLIHEPYRESMLPCIQKRKRKFAQAKFSVGSNSVFRMS